MTQLGAAGIDDLILDLRYNGGGVLALASSVAYMIAGPRTSAARVFELSEFNDKHPVTNPVTGEPISPIPFIGHRGDDAQVSLPCQLEAETWATRSQFRLVINRDDCILIDQRDRSRHLLEDTKCTAE